MLQTTFTRLLGARAPIQLAGMPGISTPELICAVARAGGVGMLPSPMMSAAHLATTLDAIAAERPGVFGVMFLMPFLDPDCVPVAAEKSSLVEFFYGEPHAALVKTVHEGGARAAWQVGSVEEALAAESAGCDLVIAQGTEAGGHVRGRTSLFELLAEVVPALRVPVIAAGGIATGSDLAAALKAGASAVRMGTRFIATKESGAHPDYVRAILEAEASDTCLTEEFSVMWPDAPHRVLRSAIAAVQSADGDSVGETQLGGRTMPVPRRSVICPTRETTGNIQAMALYAGHSVSKIDSVESAATIIDALAKEASTLLKSAD